MISKKKETTNSNSKQVLKKDNLKSKRKVKIDPDMRISELLEKYPELADVLVQEYGLHCVNCYISDFDTLREGASIHGIEDIFFEEMIEDLENRINYFNSESTKKRKRTKNKKYS